MTDSEPTMESLKGGIEDLVSQNSGTFVEQTQSLTSYQLNFLRAVLDGVNQSFGESAIREQYNLGSPSNIARLKQALIDKELIEQTESGIIIGDPVLRFWLKRLL